MRYMEAENIWVFHNSLNMWYVAMSNIVLCCNVVIVCFLLYCNCLYSFMLIIFKELAGSLVSSQSCISLLLLHSDPYILCYIYIYVYIIVTCVLRAYNF